MDITFGQRLGGMVTETTSSSEPKVMSKPVEDIPVEEIVYDAKLTYAQRLSEAREEIGKSLLLSELGQARRIGDINKEISHILMHNREDVHDRMEKRSELWSILWVHLMQVLEIQRQLSPPLFKI